MDKQQRDNYNKTFNAEKYLDFLSKLNEGFPAIPFRVAETPLFLSNQLAQDLIEAGQAILEFINRPDYKRLTERAIPLNKKVPAENEHPHFLCLDFGLCTDDQGLIKPKLIELQGFPSLYSFQVHLAEHYQKCFQIPQNWVPFGLNSSFSRYMESLRNLIIGNAAPAAVVMLDFNPQQQKTAIDFYLTAKFLVLKVLSIEEILVEGSKLYYLDQGQQVYIEKIYNRLIFDELDQMNYAFKEFDPRKEYEVEWITHPNWFYRVSKFTLPFLKGEYFPEAYFLNELQEYPSDLENYVLKPLFSFAGTGVKIHINKSDLLAIADPENWILQRKVNYAPLIQSPDSAVKAEVRLMYIWEDGGSPELVMNLVRLSKGEMIGVSYNDHSTWVGGSVAFVKTN